MIMAVVLLALMCMVTVVACAYIVVARASPTYGPPHSIYSPTPAWVVPRYTAAEWADKQAQRPAFNGHANARPQQQGARRV